MPEIEGVLFMGEETKKQNRGTKFAWFAGIAFLVAALLGFCSLFATMSFDGSTTEYGSNASCLSGLVVIPFLGSAIVFLLFRLCACGFKKASKVYRINVVSMWLLLLSYLGLLGFVFASLLPLMKKTEEDILNGYSSDPGRGFLALFSGHNDWLICLIAFMPIAFLAFYVLMYVLMVRSAKEVRAEIKAAREGKREKRRAKRDEERKRQEEKRAAEEAKKAKERAKKAEEEKALAEKKEAERLALETRKKAEKEAKAKEIATKKAMARYTKDEAIAVKDPAVSAQISDLTDELLEYQKRKEDLKPVYFAFLVVSLPTFILQMLCVPAMVECRGGFHYEVVLGDFGAISLFIAFLYFVLNLVFILLASFNTKKATLSLRALAFSSIGVQLAMMLLNLIGNADLALAAILPTLIFMTLTLALLVVSIILLVKHKGSEKIKNYISIGSLGLLIVFEAIFNLFPSYAFFAIHPNDLILNIILSLVLCALAFPLIFFSKRLSEGYALSKTLPALGKIPVVLTDEEKLEALQKECKTATKEGDAAKVAALNAEIAELSERIKNNPRGQSTFDGRLIQLIGYRLLGLLITGITFGIGYPWAKCFVERWSVKHLIVDSKRLSFDGKGVQLLGKFILWVLLTVITFGIFSFWFAIKMKKWTASHSHIEGNENPAESKSAFDGRLIQLIGYNLLSLLLIVCTLGVAYPWAKCFKENWGVKHTIVDGKRLEFDGKGIQLFGKYIVWLLLSLVTFGIYFLWLGIKMKKWVASHTHFEHVTGEGSPSSEKQSEAKRIAEQGAAEEGAS